SAEDRPHQSVHNRLGGLCLSWIIGGCLAMSASGPLLQRERTSPLDGRDLVFVPSADFRHVVGRHELSRSTFGKYASFQSRQAGNLPSREILRWNAGRLSRSSEARPPRP